MQSPTDTGRANIYRATMAGKGSGKPLSVQRIELVSNDYSSGSVINADKDSTFPRISRDGRFISFQSYATNLVAAPSLDGVAPQVFLVDMNNTYDTRTRLVSISNSNNAADTGAKSGHVSDDGSRVVFESDAQNLGSPNIGVPEIYMWDRMKGLTLISKPMGGNVGSSMNPAISGNGRYVGFMSYATGFVDNDNNGSPDCFVYDTETNKFVMVSVNTAGVQAENNPRSSFPYINKDGKIVVFMSHAKNLVESWPAPTNSSTADIFLRQWFK
jgi:Tol biopolymer transport system component